jgi:hypothetical protein
VRCGGQVRGGDGLAGPETVQAGTLVVLYLEQLKQPGGGDVQQLHAAVGQHVQEVDHVEPCPARIHDRDGELRLLVAAKGCQGAIWYSCVNPLRTCFQRIRYSARLISVGRV